MKGKISKLRIPYRHLFDPSRYFKIKSKLLMILNMIHNFFLRALLM